MCIRDSLEWCEPAGGADSVKHYTISYGLKSNTSKDKWRTKQTSGNETSLTINYLQADKEYQFRVRAECDAGVSLYSNTTLVTTYSETPPAPSNVDKVSVTDSSVTLR